MSFDEEQSRKGPEPWILVLDDDETFRGLVTAILTSEGYTVFEARSAKDATDSLRINRPALAIVDYRLPETDGVTWIGKMREKGFDFPIVFLSGTFCDASTFQRLRNILKVALILQKPIVPELFMDQIEPLLPRPRRTQQEMAQYQPTDEEQRAAAEIYSLPQVRLPSALDKALQEAKEECLAELPDMIKVLAEAIQVARESNNKALMNDAVNEAHKIKGSAGSFGFTTISDSAGKIERLISALEPDDSTMQEILWSEIIHHLADAEASAAELVGGSDPIVKHKTHGKSAHSLLMVTDSDELIDISLKLNVDIAESVIVHKLSDALVTLKTQRFDGVIIDQRVCESEDVLDFVKRMRQIAGHESAPLALILTEDDPFILCDILYVGCSMVIKPPFSLDIFEECAQTLISLYAPCMPRVLSVDDDPVLSNLIKKVLSAEGMIVQTLNEPIKVLDVLQEFQPDIVLLDVIMPGLSGYDVCRMLRAIEQWRHLIVIFLTSKSDEKGRNSAFQAGGNDFLPKPIVTSDLINRVKAQVQRSEMISQRTDRDPVTGLLRRQSFETALERMVDAAEKDKHPLTAVLMQLEGMELINKHFGTALERQVAAAFSKLLQARFRAQDARALFGDLFVLVVDNIPYETVCEAVQVLQIEFQNQVFQDSHGNEFKASIKFGIAQLFRDTDDSSQLLNTALHRLKNGNKVRR